MKAQDSYRERSKHDKRKVKRFASPDVTKLFGLAVLDPNIAGKYTRFYYRSESKRDEALIKYPGAILLNPKKP